MVDSHADALRAPSRRVPSLRRKEDCERCQKNVCVSVGALRVGGTKIKTRGRFIDRKRQGVELGN